MKASSPHKDNSSRSQPVLQAAAKGADAPAVPVFQEVRVGELPAQLVASDESHLSGSGNFGGRVSSVQLKAFSVNAPPVQLKANKTGLPDGLKSGVENLSGFSLDDVKVHYNSSQPSQLQAHAYAQGTDIHIAPGQERHLPHEAWHVVQQKQGRVQPTLQMKTGVPVNDDIGLEQEADVMGAKALQAKPVNGPVLKTGSRESDTVQAVIDPAELAAITTEARAATLTQGVRTALATYSAARNTVNGGNLKNQIRFFIATDTFVVPKGPPSRVDAARTAFNLARAPANVRAMIVTLDARLTIEIELLKGLGGGGAALIEPLIALVGDDNVPHLTTLVQAVKPANSDKVTALVNGVGVPNLVAFNTSGLVGTIGPENVQHLPALITRTGGTAGYALLTTIITTLGKANAASIDGLLAQVGAGNEAQIMTLAENVGKGNVGELLALITLVTPARIGALITLTEDAGAANAGLLNELITTISPANIGAFNASKAIEKITGAKMRHLNKLIVDAGGYAQLAVVVQLIEAAGSAHAALLSPMIAKIGAAAIPVLLAVLNRKPGNGDIVMRLVTDAGDEANFRRLAGELPAFMKAATVAAPATLQGEIDLYNAAADLDDAKHIVGVRFAHCLSRHTAHHFNFDEADAENTLWDVTWAAASSANVATRLIAAIAARRNARAWLNANDAVDLNGARLAPRGDGDGGIVIVTFFPLHGGAGINHPKTTMDAIKFLLT